MAIRITNPHNCDLVEQKITVVGKSDNQPVQLYVLANDNTWYLQEKTVVDGENWSGECFLGDKNTVVGAEYTIVAVQTDQRPQTPLIEPPIGPKSNFVNVKVITETL